ncbi:hypothetical protein [Gemmatimonas groenlandica]|uniref:Uncharacterized protein n=1 Tax=Gemmatimonas groenlandica TaxID=2732249 RepID=A0A6M4IRY5_9BACT|nr:hypothetical protein [Gemmatimonas groenlandica]QJR37533.1 hypothetical protein HKW67_19445 [Gemmatimonas groenlandica]
MLRGFAHLVATVVALPYALIAAAFLIVGQAARAKGMLAVLNVLFTHADRLVRWGIYVLPVLCLALSLAGFAPGLRRASAVCLLVLSATSLVILVVMPTSKPTAGQWLFLAPCAALIGVSVWLYRAAEVTLER